jgi:hypothetical protein
MATRLISQRKLSNQCISIDHTYGVSPAHAYFAAQSEAT